MDLFWYRARLAFMTYYNNASNNNINNNNNIKIIIDNLKIIGNYNIKFDTEIMQKLLLLSFS